MEIEDLEMTFTFIEDGGNSVTVMLKHANQTEDLERVPEIVEKALDQMISEHRLQYPETAKVKLEFNCENFLDDIDQDPPDLYNSLEDEYSEEN